MKITLLYAGLLALWFFVLSIRVVQGRMGKGKPSLGDGGDNGMLRRIRAHANFAEYVPLVLVLMAMLETQGLPAVALHVLGGMLLLGRLLHGYAFAFTDNQPFGRTAGISLTFLALLLAGALAVWQGLTAL